MPLTLIGLGLSDHKDISIKGLEAITHAHVLYLESYTSILQVTPAQLEEFYNKPVIIADRDLVENRAEDTILKDAQKKNVCFLVIGDVFSATTHLDLVTRARELKIEVNIIHNASVLTAIGATGLSVYKFGKVTSIPFDNETVTTPLHYLEQNKSIGAHTLFLLDLKPSENKYLTIANAIEYLLKTADGRWQTVDAIADNRSPVTSHQSPVFTKNTLIIGCARLGSETQQIAYGTVAELMNVDFGKAPYCLIVPGELHFMEEEAVQQFVVRSR